MTLESFELFVEQFMPLAGSVASFSWQVGEPTLMGLEFFERAVAIRAKHARGHQSITNALQTNGTLLTERRGPFLREQEFLVGLSLDGPRDLHDRYRVTEAGTPSFDRVMKAARLLEGHDITFNILVVITQQAAGRAREIDTFLAKSGFGWAQYIPCVEFDSLTGEPTPFSVRPDAYGQFLCDFFDRWSAHWPPRRFVREFDEWLSVYAGYPHPTCIFSKNCGGYVVLEHNGDVFCCDVAVEPGWRLGNIHQTPLVDLLGSEKVQAFAARHSDLGPECESCDYLALCNGGCPQHRLRFGGDHRQPTYFCAGLKTFFQHSERRFRGMAKRWHKETAARDGPAAPGIRPVPLA